MRVASGAAAVIKIVKIPLYVTMGIDPAVTDESWSDATGITINGESQDATWYTLKADGFKGQPSDVIDRAVYYALRYKPRVVSCEIIAAQRLYLPMLREAFDKYGIHASIMPFKYSTRLSKNARIAALQPRLKRGKWFFKKGECDELIRQMLRYPETGDEDDLLDAMTHHLAFSRPLRSDEIGSETDEDEFTDEDEEAASPAHRLNGTYVGRGGTRYAA